MAKLFIIESATEERIPFLRGVLVESLVRAGLSFQDAYLIAQSIRASLENNIGNKAEITTDTLKKRVSTEVRERFGARLAKSYHLGSSRERQILVQTSTDEVPFSAGILSRSLQACAIERTDALDTAKQVHEILQKGETTLIDHVALREIVYQRLKVHCSQSAANRFLSWRRFKESGLPLIVLVGGITGTGKSTLTTELAYQLNIVRTQSTDMMREIVRCYLPPTEIPTLSYSSFEAWRGLTEEGKSLPEAGDPEVIRGFLSQYKVVKHGLEATIYRAVKENHDLIIDGVHVLPSKLELDIARDQAIIIPLMLAVQNKKTLRKRLKYREKEQPERTSSRYLKQLDQIWILQSYLIMEAEEHKIPLIINAEIEEALDEILMHISNTITQHFPVTS
ncbi:MAG: AAA family ATPase [Gammaproteobacteria bacterium]|nr:AAA family ATPase [Gammaproteobacteria bacterium]